MKRLKSFMVVLFCLLIVVMMAATVLGKLFGTGTSDHIYGSLWFVLLWGLAAVLAVVYMMRRKLFRRPLTFLIHSSFVLILTGALTTWLTAEMGGIHLRQGESADCFLDENGQQTNLPFSISLRQFEIVCYAGTHTPMDYISHVRIEDAAEETDAQVSMNRILSYRHYRFYQSGYDDDMNGCTLTVSHDPAGIALSYTGYLLLFASFILFFFDSRSRFRQMIKSPLLKTAAVLVLLLCPLFVSASSYKSQSLKVLPEDLAADFGKLQVFYQGRICPVNTLARDFTLKLYGKSSYQGYTCDQVLSGWMFYFSSWQQEPMIKIKKKIVREELGIEGKYASLNDFYNGRNEYKLDNLSLEESRQVSDAVEKLGIITMLYSGELIKIYPVADSIGGLKWYAQNNTLPQSLSEDKWVFIRKSMDYLHEKIIAKDDESARYLIEKTALYQQREAGNASLSDRAIRTEILYHDLSATRALFMFCITLGFLAFIYNCICLARSVAPHRNIRRLLSVCVLLVFVYLTVLIGMRWYVSGHLPLSNGFETMQFMAWSSLLLVLIFCRRFFAALPFGLLLCGLTLLVSVLGESNPQITPLMPVLASPLLCIHVAVIMLSYSLMGFAMLNGLTACVVKCSKGSSDEALERLALISRIILYPAVFLMGIGIFVGAIWANVSWGRYWGWDPKEVWALITMMIYMAALHADSLPAFRKPMFLHIFTVIAFLSVIITYFGVNFLLGGMHSYA